jgi:putative ABC transport system substrate-binding protein
VKRRALLIGGTAIAAFAATISIHAQQPRPARVAVLISTNPQATRRLMRTFTTRMAELGWVSGKSIQYSLRFAEGRSERYPAMAAEALAEEPDLVFAPFGPVAREVVARSRTVPIVFAIVTDPIVLGLVKSLARPGGNATGVTTRSSELAVKRVQLLKEVLPALRRVGYLVNREGTEVTARETLGEMNRATSQLGIQIVSAEMGVADPFRPAINRLRARGAEAILGELYQYGRRREFLDAIADARLPAVYATNEFVDEGGLMSLSVSLDDRYRAAAGYVDRILRGAKPADLPVEEPTRHELVVNLNAARSLGLKIPASILVRADRVVE